MKRVLLSVFITVFALVFSIFSNNYLKERLFVIEEELQLCRSLLEAEDFDGAAEKAKGIREYWNKNKTVIGLFVSGDMCNNLEEELEKLNVRLKEKKADSATDSIRECLNTISQIKEKEKLSADAVL